MRVHACRDGAPSSEPSWWLKDGNGIPCVLVCDRCEDEKRARYRPEIMDAPYTEADVDEPINEED